MTRAHRLPLGRVLRLTPVFDPRPVERLPPGVRFCRAAYCILFAGHDGRHSGMHYLLLDEHGQENPAHATCSCHPSDPHR